jgi:hypothetical protein
MGEWRKDQSKNARRTIWGETRGSHDETWEDFRNRLKVHPALLKLRIEKIGSELHCWRLVVESSSGESYWTSCLRFIDDGWGYWTVMYRPDERRWRSTPYKQLPIGRALAGAEDWYKHHLQK